MRDFYKKVVVIALPVAVQQLISTSVNFIDTIMIGRLGEESIAAVGLSNKVFFLYILLLFGMTSGGSIFLSQFWGKKEHSKNNRNNMFFFISSFFNFFDTLIVFSCFYIKNIIS